MEKSGALTMLPRSLTSLEGLLLRGWSFLGLLGQESWKGWTARGGGRGWGRVKAVVAAAKHNGGDTRHDRFLRLDVVEVAVHFVGPPTPDEANAVRVDATAQHGHWRHPLAWGERKNRREMVGDG